MFNNLTDKVANASAEDILIAMGEDATDKTKGKTNAGKTNVEKTDSKKSADSKEKTTKSAASTATSTTPKAVVSEMAKKDLDNAFDVDDEDVDDEDEDADETETPAKKKDAKKDAKKAVKKAEVETEEDEDQEDEDKDEEDEDTEDTDKDDEDKEDEEDDDTDQGSDVTVPDFLKARVQLLLDKGGWKPFQLDGKNPDEIEWTEETFEEIELQQNAWIKEELSNQIMESFGPYGKEIAAHIQNGGDPDELIDIFKEQQAVKAVDISTEEGQKEIIFQYQTQILKRKPARANQEIENLIANKMLQSDAEEAKEHIEEHLKEQAETLKAEQATAKKNADNYAKQQRDKFTNDVTDIVSKADYIDDNEKKDVIKLLTNFKRELPNGQKVNDFYFKMSEFRKNLPDYIDLVRFVNNPKKFKESLKNEGKTKEANKSFKLARGVQDKKKAKPHTEIDSNRQTKKSTGFKLL
jgi:hypothetical protein